MTETYVIQNIHTGEISLHHSFKSVKDQTDINWLAFQRSIESKGTFATIGFRAFGSYEDFEKYKDAIFKNGGFVCYNVFTKEKISGSSFKITEELSISINTLRILSNEPKQPIYSDGFIVKKNDGTPFREIKENLLEELYVSSGTPVLRTTPGYGLVLFKSLKDVGDYCDMESTSKTFLKATKSDTFHLNNHTFNKLKNVIKLKRGSKNKD